MTDETTNPTDTADKADKEPRINRKLATGVAVGIGSAAIVAALLYTNRPKRPPSAD
jgi:hypothetical protein